MDVQAMINQVRDLLDQIEQAVAGEAGEGAPQEMPPEMLAELAAAPSPKEKK